MKRLFLSIVIMFLAACSFRSPNSEFYMMSSTGLAPVSQKRMSVAVAKVKVPDLLDRSQMVTYDSRNNQVNILEFNRWAEVLPDVLQTTVTNDLIAYLPQAYVKRTFFDNNGVNYNVNIEINKMQAYRGKKVILSAWWNIANASGRVLKRQQQTYETTVKGDSMADLVEAQSQAVHLMSKDIAQQLLKL